MSPALLDVTPVAEVPAGAVVHLDGRPWVVLTSSPGGPPFGFYPPWELELQPLPSGRPRTYRRTVAHGLPVLPAERRPARFVCRQHGELLLLDPATDELFTLPDARTEPGTPYPEPDAAVEVLVHDGRPVWAFLHAAVGR